MNEKEARVRIIKILGDKDNYVFYTDDSMNHISNSSMAVINRLVKVFDINYKNIIENEIILLKSNNSLSHAWGHILKILERECLRISEGGKRK